MEKECVLRKHENFEPGPKAPPLGSLEHLQFSARGLDGLPLWDKSQVAPALEMFLLPESTADFIFANQTKKYLNPKLHNIPESTAVIDYRHLMHRTKQLSDDGFGLLAQYNYQPMRDNNFVSIYGRRRYATDSNYDLTYSMRFGLDDSLGLDRRIPIEAGLALQMAPNQSPPSPGKSLSQLTFRTSSKEDPKAARLYGETDPKIFVAVLHEVVNGFSEFICLRDNPLG